MRTINYLVIHCSDSPCGDRAAVDQWHKARGWSGIGYHYVIGNGRPRANIAYGPALDGKVEIGRPAAEVGAHVHGHNRDSLGVCLIGGKTVDGRPAFDDWVTPAQKAALFRLLDELIIAHPRAVIRGHNEFPGVAKTCPNLDMDALREEYVMHRKESNGPHPLTPST